MGRMFPCSLGPLGTVTCKAAGVGGRSASWGPPGEEVDVRTHTQRHYTLSKAPLHSQASHTCTLADTCVHKHARSHTHAAYTLTHTLPLTGTRKRIDTLQYAHTRQLSKALRVMGDEFGCYFFLFCEYFLQN